MSRVNADCDDVKDPYERRDAVILALWGKPGITAEKIGKQFGITKNAVIGRAHRLHAKKLRSNGEPADAPRPSKAPRAPKEIKPKLPRRDFVLRQPNPKPLDPAAEKRARLKQKIYADAHRVRPQPSLPKLKFMGEV